MFLYNVTIIVEQDIHAAVRKYIEQQLVNIQGTPGTVTLLELLDSPHEGITYCIQLRSENRDDIELFQHQHVAAFQQSANSRYPGKILFFDSIMKYLKNG